MPNTLIAINEDFSKMVVGRNSSLSYIVAALQRREDVFIHNLPKNPAPGQAFPSDPNAFVEAIHLNPESAFAKELIATYLSENGKLVAAMELELRKRKGDKTYHYGIELAAVKKMTVAEIKADVPLQKVRIDLGKVSNVVQRLEPMNAPFPPKGTENFDVALESMQRGLPGKKFNAPIGLCDKENKKMNAKLKAMGKEEISTPTEEFKLDQDFAASLRSMFAKSVEMFPSNKPRIVLKPQYSAQSCGVCAIEIDDTKGLNLAELKSKSIGELAEHQSYNFKSGLSDAEMEKMTEILLYVQRLVTDPAKLAEVSGEAADTIPREIIQRSAAELYNGGILAQPFLQGVKKGDIRANIVKNEEGNFVLHGYTYRASARAADSKGFTTCYTTGAATSAPVEFLSELEQVNLGKSTAIFLELLNTDPEYREMYENSMEIGVDFVPVGDEKGSIVHGETNHTCPALGPISSALKEAMRRVERPELKSEYSGGVDYAHKVLAAQQAAQDRHSAKSPSTTMAVTSTPLQFSTGEAADEKEGKGLFS